MTSCTNSQSSSASGYSKYLSWNRHTNRIWLFLFLHAGLAEPKSCLKERYQLEDNFIYAICQSQDLQVKILDLSFWNWVYRHTYHLPMLSLLWLFRAWICRTVLKDTEFLFLPEMHTISLASFKERAQRSLSRVEQWWSYLPFHTSF